MKRLLGVLVMGVIAIAGWRALRPRDQATSLPITDSVQAIPVVTASGAASTSAPCQLEPGQRGAWRLDQRTTVVTARERLANQELGWSANLETEVLQVEPGSAVLLARFTSSATEAPERGLDAPFLFRVRRDCALDGFAHEVATATTVARRQQAMLHELWFSLPEAGTPAAVVVTNGTGSASALMSRAGDLVTRRIWGYDQRWAPTSGELSSSVLQVTVAPGRWFSSVSGEETFGTAEGDRAQSTLEARALSPDSEALAAASRDRSRYRWRNLLGKVDAATHYVAPDHAARVEAMRSQTLPAAVQAFTLRLVANTPPNENWQEMAAFLDAHPETIEDFGTALVTDFDKDWRPAGFVVLGQTQSPLARETLLSLWRDQSVGGFDRIRASLALTMRKDVGVEFARELRSASTANTTLGTNSLLHLGILAGTRRDALEVTEVAQDGISVALTASGRDPMALRPVFGAIANTGDLSWLPELERWSRDVNPDVRARVAIGMRRMPVDQVRAFTLEWLRRETSPDVMQSLFDVMHLQYVDAGKSIDDELAAEALAHLRMRPSVATRQSLYHLLRPHLGSPAVREVFRDALVAEVETRSGLASFLLNIMSNRDVELALSRVSGLEQQYAGRPLSEDEPLPQAPPTSSPVPVSLDRELPPLPGFTPEGSP